MPHDPLASILAYQISRKTREIGAAIGPPRSPAPRATGYLNVGYEKTPYDPKGLINKPETKSYDSSENVEGQLMHTLGQMQRSGDPQQRAFANGIIKGLDTNTPRPQSGQPPVQLQGVPRPPSSEQIIGQNERGLPIYANQDAPRPPTVKGKTIIKLDPNAVVGQNENGTGVTARGKKSYLSVDTPVKTMGRGESDIILQRDDSLRQDDAYATGVLQRKYGDDLKEAEANRGSLPRGYLDHLSKKDREAVKRGVGALQKLERGQSI